MSKTSAAKIKAAEAALEARGVDGVLELIVASADQGRGAHFVSTARSALLALTGNEVRRGLDPSDSDSVDGLFRKLGGTFGDAPQISLLATEAAQVEAFDRFGQKVLAPSLGLSQGLAELDPVDFSLYEVNPAYTCSYLLAPPELGLKVYDTDTGFHPMQGAYLYFTGRGACTVYLYGESKSSAPNDDACRYLYIPQPGQEGPRESSTIAGDLQILSRENALGVTDRAVLAEVQRETTRAIKWVLALAIYLDCANVEKITQHPDPEYRRLQNKLKSFKGRGKHEKKIKEKLAKFNQRKHIYLGESIPPVRDEAGGAGRKKSVWAVRPHYQRYRTGPNRENTTIRYKQGHFAHGRGEARRTIVSID